MAIELVRVRKVSEAHGATCRDCSAVFELANHQYWSWRKGQLMHEGGTGHRTDMSRIATRG